MNGVAFTLRTLHTGETQLAGQFLAAVRRHHDEPEIRHVATDLARWSEDHTARLASLARTLDVSLQEPADVEETDSILPSVASTAAPDRPPGLVLLDDLRDLHLAAEDNSLCWEMLTGLGKATKDDRLLDIAKTCHPQTTLQATWTKSMIKVLSPQILAQR